MRFMGVGRGSGCGVETGGDDDIVVPDFRVLCRRLAAWSFGLYVIDFVWGGAGRVVVTQEICLRFGDWGG
jgi:hypothetical protein